MMRSIALIISACSVGMHYSDGFFACAPKCFRSHARRRSPSLGARLALSATGGGPSVSGSRAWVSQGMLKAGGGRATPSIPARAAAVTTGEEAAATRETEDREFKGLWVMMNGISGKMGIEVAAACLRRGFRIAPFAICGAGGEEVSVDDLEGGNPTTVTLVASSDVKGCETALGEVRRRCAGGRLIAVDYTHPSAVNANAEFYSKNGLNFVMGTTGGDREALLSAAEDGGVYAVIAPNMGKQIVALQSTIDMMARQFPGAFAGYKLEITESHQTWKADTSGTAKALAADFAKLTGENYEVESINKVRDPEKQVAFGVPEEYLDGHAFHTYSLKSGDGTGKGVARATVVQLPGTHGLSPRWVPREPTAGGNSHPSAEFQFRHNVCGRRMYAEGTADAVEFLDKKASSKAQKRVYNMLDVLREGGM